MPSLWYFQNCFEASFPATRWRTWAGQRRHTDRGGFALTLLAARMLVLELGEIVYIVVDDDVQIAGALMRRNVAGREGLRHGGALPVGSWLEACSRDERWCEYKGMAETETEPFFPADGAENKEDGPNRCTAFHMSSRVAEVSRARPDVDDERDGVAALCPKRASFAGDSATGRCLGWRLDWPSDLHSRPRSLLETLRPRHHARLLVLIRGP